MQMARTQALTALLALLASDPGELIMDSIHSSGLANRILLDLVDSPHTTLLQVLSAVKGANCFWKPLPSMPHAAGVCVALSLFWGNVGKIIPRFGQLIPTRSVLTTKCISGACGEDIKDHGIFR